MMVSSAIVTSSVTFLITGLVTVVVMVVVVMVAAAAAAVVVMVVVIVVVVMVVVRIDEVSSFLRECGIEHQLPFSIPQSSFSIRIQNVTFLTTWIFTSTWTELKINNATPFSIFNPIPMIGGLGKK